MDNTTKKPQQSNTLIWTIVFIVGAVMLAVSLFQKGNIVGTGQVWVTPVQHAFTEKVIDSEDVTGAEVTEAGAEVQTTWIAVEPDQATELDITWTTYSVVHETELTQEMKDNAAVPVSERTFEMKTQGAATLSLSRTIGLWLAAIFTLFILSFLVGDNPAYKFAEAMVVGTSAGYLLVIGIWDTLIPNLFAKLMPALIRGWTLPGLAADSSAQWTYVIPAILIVMLLWQLLPAGGWISRWPIAFFIGITAGYRMIGYVEADLVAQIKAAIVPLWVTNADGGFLFWSSFNAILLTVATLSAMVYFFFSIEHKGIVGKTAKVGIWFLMITFGASFGYTVMGRIALLAQRMEFLFGDWLHLIPTS